MKPYCKVLLIFLSLHLSILPILFSFVRCDFCHPQPNKPMYLQHVI